MTAPLLVFAWGNASRGDDALGPLCADRLRAALAGRPDVECLDDYQLQIEHALDLAGRDRVLFVDAGLNCELPFEVSVLEPARDVGVSTHALSPRGLMQVYRELHGSDPPPCTLLAIRGERFGLGDPPGPAALAHLDAAVRWALAWVAQGDAGCGRAGPPPAMLAGMTAPSGQSAGSCLLAMPVDASRCPLCGAPNGCAVAAGAGSDAACWCRAAGFDPAQLARAAASPASCLCAACATAPHAGGTAAAGPAASPPAQRGACGGAQVGSPPADN